MSGSVAAIGCAAFLTLVAIGTAQAADLLSNANAAYKAGDMVTAIRLYREFLADHPDAAEIRSNLGAARGFQTRPYPGRADVERVAPHACRRQAPLAPRRHRHAPAATNGSNSPRWPDSCEACEAAAARPVKPRTRGEQPRETTSRLAPPS
jgi:hypothetical protein